MVASVHETNAGQDRLTVWTADMDGRVLVADSRHELTDLGVGVRVDAAPGARPSMRTRAPTSSPPRKHEKRWRDGAYAMVQMK